MKKISPRFLWILSSIIPFLNSHSLNAANDLKMLPGLWSVKTTLKMNGKEFTPTAEMKKVFDLMSPEQRKKMIEVMAKMGQSKTGEKSSESQVDTNAISNAVNQYAKNMGDDGELKMCYTKEQLKNEDILTQFAKSKGAEKDCDLKFSKKTSTSIEGTFQCKNGNYGKMSWNLTNEKSYKMNGSFENKDGKKTETNLSARFLNTDCGEIKPVDFKKSLH